MGFNRNKLAIINGLPQTVDSRDLKNHQHAFWNSINYTLFAGDTRYTTSSYRSVGAKILLSPLDLMYAVRAKLIVTSTFAGKGADSYCIGFNIGLNSYEYYSREATSFSNYTIDIEEPMRNFFKEFNEAETYIRVKVSNIGVPLDLFGVTLSFVTYGKDTYGDYSDIVVPLLYNPSNVDKKYIRNLTSKSEDFSYFTDIVSL